ncbi:putative ferric reductase transmembrane component [Candida viswanathii]|uniref:Putative ferric reductase transmembrane component n=1 Tax=Candida viswanathii TaxID=5486 RepID=A0A367XSN6_9ASCO|nr:putative ferric reductase transmembrane component [Candida viswanathii]
MVAINSVALLLFTFISATQAVGDYHIYHYDEFAVQACTGYLGKLVTFFNSTTDKVGFCNVKNQPALGTMAECIELMPWKDARHEFLKLYQYLAALQNATEFGFYNTTADKDFNKKKVFNKPILLTKKNVNAAFRAGKVVNTFRRYITMPALFKKTHAHHRTVFRYIAFVFPTRLEAIWSPAVADRTGQISLWIIPPLVMFAGRNNILQWISGWQYSRCGYVAVISFGLMCFQGMMYFRRRNYELFIAMWMFGAIGVWGFDRLIRVLRLCFFGLKTAKVQLIANETVRVSVSRPSWWKPFPGCHAFIYFMRPLVSGNPSIHHCRLAVEANTITFYIKVKGGMTHGLYQYLAQQPGQTAQIKVSIEGPYGSACLLTGSKWGLVRRHVKFYWVVRHYRSLEWFYQELLKLKDLNISTTIYPIATDLTDDEEAQEQEQEKKSDNEESVDYPDFYQITADEIRHCRDRWLLLLCPWGMVDDVRKSVVDNLDASAYRVELFEQIQRKDNTLLNYQVLQQSEDKDLEAQQEEEQMLEARR